MKRLAHLLWLLGTLGVATPAMARETDRQAAKRLFAQGKREFGKKDYHAAIKAFRQAYRLRPHAVIAYNIAVAYALVGDNLSAAEWVRRFLRRHQGDPRKLNRLLRRARQSVGELIIRVADKRAQIYVNGQLVGTGEVDLLYAPGRVAADVRIGRLVVARKVLLVSAGQKTAWDIRERDLPRRPPPRRIRRRRTPPEPTPRPPPERGLGRLHWAWFTGVAALTLGAVASAVAISLRTREIHDEYMPNQTDLVLRDKGIAYQRATNALWSVAGVTAAAAVALAIFTRWQGREHPVTVIPAASDRGLGLTLQWTY